VTQAAADLKSRIFSQAGRCDGKRLRGVLAGAVLTRVRYATVVSDEDLEIPDDVFDCNITYGNINVAVNPRVPSKR
jgi:hypothetical protein